MKRETNLHLDIHSIMSNITWIIFFIFPPSPSPSSSNIDENRKARLFFFFFPLHFTFSFEHTFIFNIATLRYDKTQMMQASLGKIVPGVVQERIDQVWLNILARYFPPQNNFQLEREPYVGNIANPKTRANVAISNLRRDINGVIDMQIVFQKVNSA